MISTESTNIIHITDPRFGEIPMVSLHLDFIFSWVVSLGFHVLSFCLEYFSQIWVNSESNKIFFWRNSIKVNDCFFFHFLCSIVCSILTFNESVIPFLNIYATDGDSLLGSEHRSDVMCSRSIAPQEHL